LDFGQYENMTLSRGMGPLAIGVIFEQKNLMSLELQRAAQN
jgi:hypothetical protein